VNQDKLRKEIAAIVRADSTHDEARKALIARAAEADASVLVPANWDEDGSLKETKGVWSSDEQRETYNDTYTALCGAISDAYQGDYEWDYVWVQDFTDDQVIFYAQGELWSVGYTLEPGGMVELQGDPARVRPVTEYVERSAEVERRKRRAEEAKGTLERRHFDASSLEIREADEGITLTGYASVTETPYEVGGFTETIKRGAFKRTLRDDPDVQLLVNHEGLPLARTRSGTLRLSENDRGLFVEADLDAEDPDVQSLVRKMKRGDIDQMSFAFQATAQSWNEDYSERTIKGVSIHRGDVSVVNMAANPAATASLRGVVEFLETRAGKTLSTATMSTLTQVLRLVADADDAVDEAQPLLAELMGVPNPDDDESEPDEDDAERGADENERRLRTLRSKRSREADELYLLKTRKAA